MLGDVLRPITPRDQLILDATGNVVGFKSPNANGSDLRVDLLATTTVTLSRNLTAADTNCTLRVNSASTVTLNLPAGLSPGFNCAIVQFGAGKATVTADGGVALNSVSAQFSTSAQYAVIGVVGMGLNEFVVSGSLGV